MPNRIKPRRSYTANAVPTTSDLETNEIALNFADSKLYVKNPAGQIVSVTLGGGGGGGGSLSATVTIPASGDQYWSTVGLLLRGDGDNDGTTFVDSGPKAKTIARVGGTVTSTAQSKFGGASLYFDGTDDQLEVGTSFDADVAGFGTGDFTIEFWFRAATTSTRMSVLSAYNATSPATGLVVQLNKDDGAGPVEGSVSLGYGDTPIVSTGAGVWSANTWTHLAVVRSSGTATLYVNGVSQASASNSTNISDGRLQSIGGLYLNGSYIQDYSGYLDDLRITKAARWVANFTPPTATYATGTYTAAQTLPVVFSDAAPAITISSQPTNQTAASGAATFGVTATVSPSGTATYQWERSDDGGSTFSAVSGATSATLALTGLTNASDDNDRYRVVVSAVGAASVTSNAVTLTVAASTPPLALAGTRPSNLASGTTANGYTLTGVGTAGSPVVLMVGGGNNNDYRVWLIVNQTGTLNWTVTASSEDGYDGGRLYSAGAPANYTPGGFNDATPAGYTAVSNWLSGSQTQTGTTSVTAGQHIVLRWARDDGGDGGNNRIELSAYMS